MAHGPAATFARAKSVAASAAAAELDAALDASLAANIELIARPTCARASSPSWSATAWRGPAVPEAAAARRDRRGG